MNKEMVDDRVAYSLTLPFKREFGSVKRPELCVAIIQLSAGLERYKDRELTATARKDAMVRYSPA